MPYENCSVCDPYCKGRTKAKCFSCGDAVCTNCSSIRQYYNYGRVRLCNNCQSDIDGNDNRVIARWERQEKTITPEGRLP